MIEYKFRSGYVDGCVKINLTISKNLISISEDDNSIIINKHHFINEKDNF
ncbi:MAG: hypothetical protein ACTSQP_14345 [Promethearchaeota archaeon]